MITVERNTETNELAIVVTGNITTKEEFNEVFSALMGQTDLTNIAQLKEHTEKDDDGNKTGNVTGLYLSSQTRLPGVHAATFAGAKWYTKHMAVKVDMFNIADSPFATTASAPKAEAATLDANSIKERLAAAREYAASKPKTPKPGDVVAVAAKNA